MMEVSRLISSRSLAMVASAVINCWSRSANLFSAWTSPSCNSHCLATDSRNSRSSSLSLPEGGRNHMRIWRRRSFSREIIA